MVGPKKLTTELSYNLAIALLSIYPKDLKAGNHEFWPTWRYR